MSNLIIVVGSFKYGIVFIKFVMEKSGQAKCIQEEATMVQSTYQRGKKTPIAHGAVQLSDAKAFSLDWKVLIQRQEFCRCGTNFGAVEISIV